MQCFAHEPLYDIDPRTGASIEVFYADRDLETFGRCGAGWFWWPRRRGHSPDGSPTDPFATSYAAFRHAMNTTATITWWRRSHCDCERAMSPTLPARHKLYGWKLTNLWQSEA